MAKIDEIGDSVARYLTEVLPSQHGSKFRASRAQGDYAQSLSKAMSMGAGRLHCIEGDTGIGKSLAYLLSAAHWVASAKQQSRRVIISTHSRALQRQLLSSANQDVIRAYLDHVGLRPVSTALRMGRENYVSEDRVCDVLGVSSIDEVIENPSAPARHRQLARWVQHGSGCLLDIEEDELPEGVRLQDICLKAYDSLPASIRERNEQSSQSDLLVINHALLVNDLVRGRSITGRPEAQDLLLIDESEHFPVAASQMLSDSVSLASAARLARRCRHDSAGDHLESAFHHFLDPEMAGKAKRLEQSDKQGLISCLEAVRRSRTTQHIDPEDGMAWGDVKAAAGRLLTTLQQGSSAPVLGYSAIRGLPSINLPDGNAGGCLRVGMEDRITILTSATLSDMDDAERVSYQYMFSSLLVPAHDSRVGVVAAHEASQFGKLNFRVFPDFPDAIQAKADGTGHHLASGFAERVVKRICEQRGRTLVLCASYADVDILQRAWPDNHRHRLVTHPPGAAINRVAQSLADDAVLLTPAGWEGLSPERGESAFWSCVAILRVPFAPLDDIQLLRQQEVFEQRGQPPREALRAAVALGHWRNHIRMRHKMRQGLGRAIRHPDDEVEILLFDPRFASGQSEKQSTLVSAAIPPRFRKVFRDAIEKGSKTGEARLPDVVL